MKNAMQCFKGSNTSVYSSQYTLGTKKEKLFVYMCVLFGLFGVKKIVVFR